MCVCVLSGCVDDVSTCMCEGVWCEDACVSLPVCMESNIACIT